MLQDGKTNEQKTKSSYHVGGMSIVFVQLVLSVFIFGAGKRERNDSGKISGADRGRSFGVFWNCVWFTVFEGKEYIVGLVISILVDLILVSGIFSIYKADKLLVQGRGSYV